MSRTRTRASVRAWDHIADWNAIIDKMKNNGASSTIDNEEPAPRSWLYQSRPVMGRSEH
jgi:hypothetical protein